MKQLRNSATSQLPVSKDAYIYSLASTAAPAGLGFDSTQALSPSDLLAVISSDNTLSLLSPETLQLVPSGHIQHVSSSVTCLVPLTEHPQHPASTLLTCGRDGLVHAWDLRTARKALTLSAPPVSGSSQAPALSALAAHGSAHGIAAGTELEGQGPGNVSVCVWDVRAPQGCSAVYGESHTDTVTELRLLPGDGNGLAARLLSGSTDGLVTVFDARVVDEDDAVLQVSNHYSAVHHAGLVGGNEGEAGDIYALGTDEKLAFYAQQSPDATETPESTEVADTHDLGDIRDKIECDYALGLWNSAIPGTAPLLAVGRHNEDVQDVRLLPLLRNSGGKAGQASGVVSQWALDETSASVISLPGAHGAEVVRDLYCVEAQSVVFTCGEDGTVRQWSV